MDKVNIYIPVYNEINHIEAALNSVVGEADKIIISDNASDDGTSDICQTFAAKYSEIKYYRQKENIGLHNNVLFCLDKVMGEYVRPFTGHHVASHGTTKSMLKLMNDRSNVTLVYPEYAFEIDNSSFIVRVLDRRDYENDLKSENVFVRMNALFKTGNPGTLLYGFYRTDDIKYYVNSFRPDFTTDWGLLAFIASKGILLADNNYSFYFRRPVANENPVDYHKRICKSLNSGEERSPYTYMIGTMCEYLLIAKELEKFPEAPVNYSKNLLKKLFYTIFYFSPKHLSLKDIHFSSTKKEAVRNEVFCIIQKYKKNVMWRHESIKKTIKNILPFGMIKLLKHYRYV
jgi:glycosyltransferase involved in cell wall biosynthesis